MYKVAATVGRFQTPYLHLGHRVLIKKLFALASERVVIYIGDTSMNPTERDQLPFKVRKDMIKDFIRVHVKASHAVEIVQLKDNPFSDERWSETLSLSLRSRSADCVLVGGRDSFLNAYHGTVQTIEIPAIEDVSSTAIRAGIDIPSLDMFSEREKQWFRAGIIYGQYNRPYPNLYPVVDCIIWKGDGSVLLGRKHGEIQWRIPGGFVNADDHSFEAAAIREAHEEVGMIELDKPSYVCSSIIDDRRYKGLRDCVYTSVFAMMYIYGKPEAGDDLEEVKWFQYEDILKLDMIEEHKTFIQNWYDRSFPKPKSSIRPSDTTT